MNNYNLYTLIYLDTLNKPYEMISDIGSGINYRKSRVSFYKDNKKLKVKENEVLLEKIGWVKIKENIPLNCKYTKPAVSHDGKY